MSDGSRERGAAARRPRLGWLVVVGVIAALLMAGWAVLAGEVWLSTEELVVEASRDPGEEAATVFYEARIPGVSGDPPLTSAIFALVNSGPGAFDLGFQLTHPEDTRVEDLRLRRWAVRVAWEIPVAEIVRAAEPAGAPGAEASSP